MSHEQSSSRPPTGNDNHTNKSGRSLITDMVMAVRFYSRLPIPGFDHETPNLGRIAPALPFASLLIGLGPAFLLFVALALKMPPLFAACLGVAAQVIVTGAMAEDAIADSADALFGGTTMERRLEIFKDSRHGTYGVTALVLFLALKITAIASFASISPLAAAGIWLGAGILARSGALWLTLKLPPARREGAAAAAGQVNVQSFAIGAALASLLAFVLAAPFSSYAGMLLALVLCGLIAWGWMRLCRHMIGGQTGDLIGALQALLEIAALCAFIIF